MFQVVWFKRDLRIRDHRPLVEAARRGPVLPLYIVEPEVLEAEDYDPCHWSFTRSSLLDLREDLASLGQPLVIRIGEAVAVLQSLPIAQLWAHEETGNWITYQRDRRVRRWTRESKIPFTEYPSNGVVRRLPSRDGWSRCWEQRMAEPVLEPPLALAPAAGVEPGVIPGHKELGLGPSRRGSAQQGGEAAAFSALDSFLGERGARYHKEMSSPLTAEVGCSRLSPYLAYGNLSIKQAVQAARYRASQVDGPEAKNWKQALRAFDARLHWRSHFMQKLEDEPRIEFENFVHAYDGMREPLWRDEYFEAWKSGRTGYPLVDACMRMLEEQGWINFRMRAMLVSFASYHLWLHWRQPALHAARLFVDYEPGIHYSQFQMQSGTTGINTLRMYSPIKQLQDQDPDGVFVRRWLPELNSPDYPAPIVDHKEAIALARQRMGAVRRQGETREQAAAVMARHGSRKKSPARRGAKQAAPKPPEEGQMMLFSKSNPDSKGTKKSKSQG